MAPDKFISLYFRGPSTFLGQGSKIMLYEFYENNNKYTLYTYSTSRPLYRRNITRIKAKLVKIYRNKTFGSLYSANHRHVICFLGIFLAVDKELYIVRKQSTYHVQILRYIRKNIYFRESRCNRVYFHSLEIYEYINNCTNKFITIPIPNLYTNGYIFPRCSG